MFPVLRFLLYLSKTSYYLLIYSRYPILVTVVSGHHKVKGLLQEEDLETLVASFAKSCRASFRLLSGLFAVNLCHFVVGCHVKPSFWQDVVSLLSLQELLVYESACTY
ncbi:hypothetical protein PS15m_005712 [Mucor circinelloides]